MSKGKTRDHVTFEAQGQNWTLRMVPSAWMELEDAGLGNIQEIGSKLQTAMSFKTMLQIFLAGLRHKHPQVTEEAAAAIADEIGSEEMLATVTSAIQSSFPKSMKAATEGNGGDPVSLPGLPTTAGTGINS